MDTRPARTPAKRICSKRSSIATRGYDVENRLLKTHRRRSKAVPVDDKSDCVELGYEPGDSEFTTIP